MGVNLEKIIGPADIVKNVGMRLRSGRAHTAGRGNNQQQTNRKTFHGASLGVAERDRHGKSPAGSRHNARVVDW